MTKIERVLRELNDLYEFNCRLQEWKKRATIHDPLAEVPRVASNMNATPASEHSRADTSAGEEPR